MIRISLSADVRKASSMLGQFRKQIPYIEARTMTNLAKQVQAAEKAGLSSVFDKPTPFTLRGVGITPATKGLPVATVFLKDKQAQYLAPYEFGGSTFLGTRVGVPVPVGIRTNQYGNLTRNKLAQLAANPKVFKGRVHGVSGFWQRMAGDHLKLLVEWTSGVQVKQHLDFASRAKALVAKQFAPTWETVVSAAIKTMK